MSATAIAQVTAALKGLLKAYVPSAVQVTLLQPSDTLSNNSLNLYLYRTAEMAQLKNMDWRGDRAHSPTNFPALSLDLYYLLTPFADPPASSQNTLPPAHMLLGQAMQALHEHNVLNDVHMVGFDFDTFTGIDDLRNSFDKITARLHPISLDELSKIWSMFNQPYRLSVAYQVSLVQIAPTAPARRIAPVLVTGLDVFAMGPPRLTALDPPRGGTGGPLTLHGFGLARRSFTSTARFGGQPLDPVTVTAHQLQITVPIRLEAGPEQAVRAALDDQVSNALLYVVSPWLRRVQPLRGAPGPVPIPPLPVTLEIEGEDLLTAAGLQVTLNGLVQAHTVIDSSHLQIIMPANLPNGLYPLRVRTNGQTSNSRDFEVIPFLQGLTPATPVVGNALQIDGQRLAGTRVLVAFGPSTVEIGANANAAQVQVRRVPRLDPGNYDLRVLVDGSESNSLPFTSV